MSRRPNPTMPGSDFGFLLVEGGDEDTLCKRLARPNLSLCCWKVDGRDFVPLARLAKNDPNFRFARSIGIVLDIENDLAAARSIAQRALEIFGATQDFVHGTLSTGSPRLGAFLLPNDRDQGAIETLCRSAVRDPALAACTDALVACAGQPHAANVNARANEDKGWLRAYLGMISPPDLRFHQALEHPQGIDLSHAAFAPLREFLRAL